MMRSAVLALAIAATTAVATPFAVPETPAAANVSKRATYVTDITKCPKLPARAAATSVHDLRPDQITVIGALGDSITAGCFAKGEQGVLSVAEWRGVSYAGGADKGAITLPNLFKHYSDPQGGSVGFNPVPEICFGSLCPIGPVGWNPLVDQLNAALSGAKASNILHEVRDYLVPQLKFRGVQNDFKYLSLQIGSNDICSSCVSAETGIGPSSANEFEEGIRDALEYLRKNTKNTIINLFGVFKVSDVYTLTKNEPYCSKLGLPHYNIECACALLGGTLGQTTRDLMDKLMDQYNERLIKIVKEYQTAHYADFAVLWFPPNVPLASYPIESLSKFDCFHPSEATHRLIATEMWNRLTATSQERAQALAWDVSLEFRCLEAGDRFRTSDLI